MKCLSTFTLLAFALTIACCTDDDIYYGYDRFELTCQEEESPYYFKGIINGMEVCRYVGFNDIDMRLWSTSSFISESNTIDLTDTSSFESATWNTMNIGPNSVPTGVPGYGTFQDGDLFMQIETPIFPPGTDNRVILEAVLKEGDLPLAAESRFDAFNLKIYQFFVQEDGKQLMPGIKSFKGTENQGFLRLMQYDTTHTLDKIRYDLRFEFECTMYEDTSSEKEFGYLEDGEFAIFFNIDK